MRRAIALVATLIALPATATEYSPFGACEGRGDLILEASAVHDIERSCDFLGEPTKADTGEQFVEVQCRSDMFGTTEHRFTWYVTSDGKLVYSFGEGLSVAYPCGDA